MSLLDHEAICARLRHRPPALGIAREVEAAEAGVRAFATVERETWHPAQLLDAGAQAAGLCARGEAPAQGLSLLVVAYEGVRWPGSLRARWFRVEVRKIRAFLSMYQFALRVWEGAGTGGEVCLEARVTLAKEGG